MNEKEIYDIMSVGELIDYLTQIKDKSLPIIRREELIKMMIRLANSLKDDIETLRDHARDSEPLQ